MAKNSEGFNILFDLDVGSSKKDINDVAKSMNHLDKQIEKNRKLTEKYEAGLSGINKRRREGAISAKEQKTLEMQLTKEYDKRIGQQRKISQGYDRQRRSLKKLQDQQRKGSSIGTLKGALTGKLQGMAGGLGGLGAGVSGGLMTGFGAGAAAIYGGKKVTDAINEQQRYQRELANSAELLGTTTRGLAGMNFALGRLAGLSAEDVTENLMDLRERLGEIASDPTGALGKDAKAIGLNAQSLLGKDVTTQLKAVVEAIRSQANPEKQLYFARSLFGDQAARMLTQAAADQKALGELIKKGEENAVLMSERSLETWQRIKDGLQVPINGLKQAAASFAESALDIASAATLMNEDQQEYVKQSRRRDALEQEMLYFSRAGYGLNNPYIGAMNAPQKGYGKNYKGEEGYLSAKSKLEGNELILSSTNWGMMARLLAKAYDLYADKDKDKALTEADLIQSGVASKFVMGTLDYMRGGNALERYNAGLEARREWIGGNIYGGNRPAAGTGVLLDNPNKNTEYNPTAKFMGNEDIGKEMAGYMARMTQLAETNANNASRYSAMRAGKLAGEDQAVTEMKLRHAEEERKLVEQLAKSNLYEDEVYSLKLHLKKEHEKELELLEKQNRQREADAWYDAKIGKAKSAQASLGFGEKDSIDKLMDDYNKKAAEINKTMGSRAPQSHLVDNTYALAAQRKAEMADRKAQAQRDEARNRKLDQLRANTNSRLNRIITVMENNQMQGV